MPRFDVTTIGEGQLRYSVPADVRLERTDQFNVSVACTEANVLSLLSRLGWKCGWVSALPKSPMGRRVANEYTLSGLDLSAVVWDKDKRLATYYVEYARMPRQIQVYYDRQDTCFTNLTSEDIDWDYLLDTKLFHISGLTIPLADNIHDILWEGVERAKAKGVKVSLDVNYRSRIWTPEKAAEVLTPFMEKTDILFCGRRDTLTIFGGSDDNETLIHNLQKMSGAETIVTTLSEHGVMALQDGKIDSHPAVATEIVDRIGAGDAMVGGVLHGWLQGDVFKGLRYGSMTAGMALTQFGDVLVTNSDELEEMVNRKNDGDIISR